MSSSPPPVEASSQQSNDTTLDTGPDWDQFNTDLYVPHHYGKVSGADSKVANWVVGVLRNSADIRKDYGSLIEIGVGATLRSSMAVAGGNLRKGAPVIFTDVGDSQLKATKEAVKSIQNGDLKYWADHEADVVRGNPEIDEGRIHPWMEGALARLCINATVKPLDISEECVGPADIRVEAHCLCSNTDDPNLYEERVSNFYRGMEPGQLAVRFFDANSTGYLVDGIQFPGIPINAESIREQAERMGLGVVGTIEVEFGDRVSTFSGIGAAVLVMPGAGQAVLDLGSVRC